jgi:hypothetical protein
MRYFMAYTPADTVTYIASPTSKAAYRKIVGDWGIESSEEPAVDLREISEKQYNILLELGSLQGRLAPKGILDSANIYLSLEDYWNDEYRGAGVLKSAALDLKKKEYGKVFRKFRDFGGLD